MDRQPSTKVVLFTSLISLLHALANPPLYGWMSQRYRRGYLFVFKMALSVCGGQRPKRRLFLSKFWPPISRGKMLASPFHVYTFYFLIRTLIPREKWWILIHHFSRGGGSENKTAKRALGQGECRNLDLWIQPQFLCSSANVAATKNKEHTSIPTTRRKTLATGFNFQFALDFFPVIFCFPWFSSIPYWFKFLSEFTHAAQKMMS